MPIRALALRLAALGAVLVWCWTLQTPVLLTFVEYFPEYQLPVTTSTTSGGDVLLFGWLAPTSLGPPTEGGGMPSGYGPFLPYIGWGDFSLASIAWYANPMWAWNIVRMLMARPPRPVLAVAAALFAVVGVQPFYDGGSDDHGVNGATIPVLGAYVWAAAMAIPLVAVVATMTIQALRRRGFRMLALSDPRV